MRLSTVSLLLGFLVALGISEAVSVPVTPISKEILGDYTKSVNSHGLSSDDLKNPSLTYDVVSSKDLLKIPLTKAEKSNVCTQISSKLSTVSDHTDLFYLSMIAEKLQCSVSLSLTARNTLNAAISADYAAQSFHGITSLFSLSSLSSSPVSIHDYDVLDVVRMFKDLQLPDGTSRAGVSTIGSSLDHTGSALHIMALALGDATLSASALPLVTSFIETAAAATSKLCAAPALAAADTLISGLLALSTAVEGVIDVNLNCLVPVVSSQAAARSIPSVAATLRLAHAMTSPSLHNPFFIAHTVNSQTKSLDVAVTTAFSAPVASKHYAVAATLDGLSLAPAATEDTFTLPTLTPGSHALSLAAAAEKQPAQGLYQSASVSTAVRAPHTATVSKLVLSGTSSRTAVAAPLLTLSPPFTASAYTVDAEHSRFLLVKLAFASSAPNAPSFALRMVPRHAGRAAVFPLTPVSSSSASAALELAHPAVQAQLAGSGVYDVTLEYTVRHAAPVAVSVATLTLDNIQTAMIQRDASSLPAPISHSFGPEQRERSIILPLFGSIAVILPLVAALGLILRNQPMSVTLAASEWVAAGAFLATLAGCLLLVLVYWVSLSLLTVIPIAAAAGVVLLFTGHRALKLSADRRGCAVVDTVSVDKKTE